MRIVRISVRCMCQAFDGVHRNAWCSDINTTDDVVITVLLAGRFHVRRIDLVWEHGGARDYQVHKPQ